MLLIPRSGDEKRMSMPHYPVGQKICSKFPAPGKTELKFYL